MLQCDLGLNQVGGIGEREGGGVRGAICPYNISGAGGKRSDEG